jgi:hypothetical protein
MFWYALWLFKICRKLRNCSINWGIYSIVSPNIFISVANWWRGYHPKRLFQCNHINKTHSKKGAIDTCTQWYSWNKKGYYIQKFLEYISLSWRGYKDRSFKIKEKWVWCYNGITFRLWFQKRNNTIICKWIFT